MSQVQRATAPSPTRERSNIHVRIHFPVPPISLNLSSSPTIRRSQHFTLFLSLASSIRDSIIESGEPDFSNFLANIRDHDVNMFTLKTDFVGRGATFSVRRTTMEEHQNVIFKSSLRTSARHKDQDEFQRLDIILRELRVLTHSPIRDHKNIVKLFAVGWEGDPSDSFSKWPVLVQEYAEIGTLADYFEYEPNLGFSVKLGLCTDVAAGILALHNSSIVHADLKVENVLVFAATAGDCVTAKLSDFGTAMLPSDSTRPPSNLTRPWNAPEWQEEHPHALRCQSDVYSLGLLIWRIALNGKDPFKLTAFFSLPSLPRRYYAAIEVQKKGDREFLSKVKASVEQHFDDDERAIFAALFDATIRTDMDNRSLHRAVNILCQHLDPRQEVVQSSFAGLEYNGQTDVLKPKLLLSEVFTEPIAGDTANQVLESMAYACADSDPHQAREVNTALAALYLAGEDFGFELNVSRGLRHLCYAANLGSFEHRAWLLQFHQAFDQPVPDNLRSNVLSWLMHAAAVGSMTAVEDLVDLGLNHVENEHVRAVRALKTVYCGAGEEMFPNDDFKSDDPAIDDAQECYKYIRQEMAKESASQYDISGHLLRLAASCGSRQGIDFLVLNFPVNSDATDAILEFPLLFAARSGHLEALKGLLNSGASALLASNTGETALHWQCSLEDKDVLEAAQLLVSAGAQINAHAEKYNGQKCIPWLETDFVEGTPLHRAIARNSLGAV
ncbi:uncharacterized protein KY384_001596 [Bacidia gigantensis]|uniref:uncharacterized protein n=1 Tax=Bacidia gigantensis TaxID=2732470 RepID=UPI001D0474AB|nr:uncharacterized protein KY384_001596 [Bacidia gigantensis]KAG8533855.1 hypothetical protein KY384_001596 [Bacidia gigantensis]